MRVFAYSDTKDLFLGLLAPERAVVGSGAQQPKFPQNEAVVRAERARGLMTSQKTNSRTAECLYELLLLHENVVFTHRRSPEAETPAPG